MMASDIMGLVVETMDRSDRGFGALKVDGSFAKR